MSDGDFGSPNRPAKPPHSSISRAALKSFWESLAWKTCAVTVAPPPLDALAAGSSPAGDTVVIHPEPGQERRTFWLYTVEDGRIRGRRAAGTGGFSAACGERAVIRWPAKDRSYTLVRLRTGPLRGSFVAAKYVADA